MFQVILLDSPSKAGTRLVIPCLFTPLGGLIAGIIMSRWGRLSSIVRVGAALMLFGNVLVMLLRFNDSGWKYLVYVIPANLGQGMVYPGILFTFLAAFDHAGKILFLALSPAHYRIRERPICLPSEPANNIASRSRRLRLNRLPHPLSRKCLGRRRDLHHHAEYT